MLRPMPPAAPVINAVRPRSLFMRPVVPSAREESECDTARDWPDPLENPFLASGIMEGGRFIPQEANNLPPRTPQANMAALYETCVSNSGGMSKLPLALDYSSVVPSGWGMSKANSAHLPYSLSACMRPPCSCTMRQTV